MSGRIYPSSRDMLVVVYANANYQPSLVDLALTLGGGALAAAVRAEYDLVLQRLAAVNAPQAKD